MKKKADVDCTESQMSEDTLNLQTNTPAENSCDNEFAITLSRSLAKQLHNLSKYEGIHSIDLLLELVTEGIARRIMEDQTRQPPSHLMTRNGYVDQHTNAQPSMSHHAFQSNVNMRDGQGNNRAKNNFQRHTPSSARPQQNARYNNRSPQNNSYTNGNANSNPNSYFKPPKKSEF